MIREYAEHVYKVLGPGYSERVYHNAMEVVLRKNGVHYETERIVPIEFEGHTIGNLRADLILNNKTVSENIGSQENRIHGASILSEQKQLKRYRNASKINLKGGMHSSRQLTSPSLLATILLTKQ